MKLLWEFSLNKKPAGAGGLMLYLCLAQAIGVQSAQLQFDLGDGVPDVRNL